MIDGDFAHRFFGDADPIGQTLNLTDPDQKVTIVGEVGHVMHWGLDNDAGFPLHAQIYRSYARSMSAGFPPPDLSPTLSSAQNTPTPPSLRFRARFTR